ncbi:unnamed protein product, partial [Heterosigma akashiwo]
RRAAGLRQQPPARRHAQAGRGLAREGVWRRLVWAHFWEWASTVCPAFSAPHCSWAAHRPGRRRRRRRR